MIPPSPRASTLPLQLAALAAVAMSAAALRAQDPVNDYELVIGPYRTVPRDDYYETHAQGGFRLEVPKLGLTLRGENVLILNDLETARGMLGKREGSGLPTRGVEPPEPRRRLSPDAVRARLQRTLSAVGRPQGVTRDRVPDDALRLFRYLYCEGDVVVVQDGVEVMRCDRLWISPVDDRIVVENAELRYLTGVGARRETLTVRGPRLVKQGPRWVGADVVLTTCTAAEPHFALSVTECEIIERPGEFEVVTRGQTLQVGGVHVLPLPDARVFTGSQSQFPIKRLSAGYSGQLGAQLDVLFGLPWNTTGGVLHEWLTGRPAQEFRGDWEFGVGWIQERGYPLEAALTYGAPGVYEGRTEGFFLDDEGRNLREIKSEVDGSPILEDQRTLIRSWNRVHLGESTHVDLVAFQSSDPAVYSDFFPNAYRGDEVPETSAYLHHADGNHLLTIGGRFNLNDDFSWRDDRFLSQRFVEELPVATYQWLAQPIATTPWETPIVLDLETQVGQRRSDWDDLAGTRFSDRSLRADQHVELSTPFSFAGLRFRPYVSGRGTFYDDTPSGESEERVALEGGLQVSTRLSRVYSWLGEEGPEAVRHVISPRVTYRNRFHVDDQPGEFFQYETLAFEGLDPLRLRQLGYDTIDLLTERELVRFEVRNLMQKMVDGPTGRQPRDFVFLDIAQDVYPSDARDNRGDSLGLFYYDLLLRPTVKWLPVDDFALAVYGDHDWLRGMQTFDAELQFGKVLGARWTVEYREDQFVDGAIRIGASTDVLDRWSMFAGAQRDLDRDEWLAYNFGLARRDHDWVIGLRAVYNPFSNETVFRIEFQPNLGGGRRTGGRFAGSRVRESYTFDY